MTSAVASYYTHLSIVGVALALDVRNVALAPRTTVVLCYDHHDAQDLVAFIHLLSCLMFFRPLIKFL